jgi:glycosyltransferase involved in cell wall biosynthesis
MPSASHNTPSVSVVIPARNEQKTIASVIQNARLVHPRTEVIVVVNGSTDQTAETARRLQARVYELSDPLGHDAGRAFGARQARGRAILFLDADFAVAAAELRPFVRAVLQDGVDLALNSYPRGVHPHSFSTLISKHMLNSLLRRPDLLASSMTAVPHALSRKALQTISADDLRNPPLAQAKLLQAGCKAARVQYVPVSRLNPLRHKKLRHFLTELILGDHLEAVQFLLQQSGRRGGYTDLGRNRELLQREPSRRITCETAAIIAANNEARNIGRVVKNAFAAGVDRVLVVDNGSQDRTAELARQAGADVIRFRQRLGHDVGRGIGCLYCRAQVYVFLDGDLVIPPEQIRPFLAAVRHGGADVALNDLNALLKKRKRVDDVTVAKRFLNHALLRGDLGANSLVAVPHALSRHAVERIGVEALGVPPLAMVRAVQSKLAIRAVQEVDVFTANPIRQAYHRSAAGNLVADLILGDTCEALSELLAASTARGFFRGASRIFE